MTASDVGGPPELRVGASDAELDTRLSRELDRYNVAASGIGDQRELTVQVRDDRGEVTAALALIAPSVYLEDLDLTTIAADLGRIAAHLPADADTVPSPA